MITIENKFIPFKGFQAMAFYGILFTRDNITEQTIRHEGIHTRQQVELLVLTILILSICCLLLGLSWWWLLLAPAAPFILYWLSWVVEIILPPYDRAYSNICFETEAQYNESNPNYLSNRRPFAFLKYISNKKYPYLPMDKR